MNRIPNLRIVVGACLIAVAGYAIFSGWVVFWSDDAAARGDVIGTWKSFAVMAFGFWLGSSSQGKAKDDPGSQPPTQVIVKNDTDEPVPTQAQA